MVKKLTLVAILFFVRTASPAQTVYDNVITLEKLNGQFSSSSPSSITSVASLLATYMPDSLINTGDALKTIENFTTHNPFMRNYFPHPRPDGQKPLPFRPYMVLGAVGFSPFLNTDVTTITDGLAKFLVSRTKEELSVAFFSTLKEDLEDKKFAAVQTLFTLTFQQLELMGDKVYQFSAYLNDLRNAFISDLNNFPTTIPYVLTLPQYQPYFKAHPWVAGVIQLGCNVGSQLSTKTNGQFSYMSTIVKNISDNVDNYFPVSSANPTVCSINGAIKTFGLISSSFAPTFSKGPWVGSSQMLQLINNDTAFNIYLGLLYQQALTNPIDFGGGLSLSKLMDSVAVKTAAIEAVKNSITGLFMQMNLVDEEKAMLDTMKATDNGIQAAYYGYFSTGTAILQKGLALVRNMGEASGISLPTAFLNNVTEYTNALQDAGSIYINIQQKKFPAVISSTVDFFTAVLADMSKTDGNVTKVLQRLSTYGTFIAGVASAKSSSEVDSIIAQTVLPTGSSYVKKHARFNISLQAYTGLYGGQQRQATDTKFVGAAGVYAPVGIGFSWGLPRSDKNKAPGSFTIFASVIDIGPLVSFRFSNYNDSIANSAKVRLSQIVSPGLHLVYGVPKLPISLGLGCNWAPLITNVESTAITADSKNAFRYQAFIAVDIPFFTFYNNPR